MKSKGKNQGFQCVKCGRILNSKSNMAIPRKITKEIYVPDMSAHRHLTRPTIRMGKKNMHTKFFESGPWFSVYKN